MKRFIAMCALAAPATVAAGALFPLPVGQSLGAPAGGATTIQSVAHNPAASSSFKPGGWRFGLGAIGAGYETGDFDNLTEQVQAIERDLRSGNLSLNEAETVRDRANMLLAQLGRDGYVKGFASVQPPFLPMAGADGFFGGTLTLSVVGTTGARLSVLDDAIEISETSPGVFRIVSDTAAYGQAAAGATVALGYSAPLPEVGPLSLGGRLSYHAIELSHGVVALRDIEETTLAATQNAVEEEFDRNRRRASALSLDMGAIWTAASYRAGATLLNLNEPSFDHAVLGQDCVGRPAAEVRNCEAAATLIAEGRLAAAPHFRMERQLQIEGAVFTADRAWTLAGSLDVNPVRDVTGDRYQWLAMGGAYHPAGRFWVPGLRLGLRQNLTDSGLSLASIGFSLFRVLNLDLVSSMQMVNYDGHRRPRSALASLSLELPL